MRPESFAVERMGDRGILMSFGSRPSRKLTATLVGLAASARFLEGVVDAIPGHRTLLLEVEPWAQEQVRAALPHLSPPGRAERGRLHEIVAAYDGEDLQWVAKHLGMPAAEVARIHRAKTYDVRMLGSPGFVYLSEVSSRIRVPRMDRPRLSVPAGSIGIGGNQTGIYARARPGGWRIIARAGALPRLSAGDRVRFVEQ